MFETTNRRREKNANTCGVSSNFVNHGSSEVLTKISHVIIKLLDNFTYGSFCPCVETWWFVRSQTHFPGGFHMCSVFWSRVGQRFQVVGDDGCAKQRTCDRNWNLRGPKPTVQVFQTRKSLRGYVTIFGSRRWEGMSPFLAHVDHMFVECQREFKNMDVGNPKNTPAIRGWFWYVLIQPIYSEFGDCWLLALPNSIIKENFTKLKQTIWGSYPNPTALRWQSEIVKLLQLSRKIPFRSTARTSPFIILLEIRMLTVFFWCKKNQPEHVPVIQLCIGKYTSTMVRMWFACGE